MPRRPLAKPPAVGALAVQDQRQALLEAAGLTPTRQGELLRAAITTAEIAMTGAMSPLTPVGSPPVPDWHARLSAARFISSILGAAPSKSATPSGAGQVTVVIEMPEWARSEPKVIGHSSTKDVLSLPRQS